MSENFVDIVGYQLEKVHTGVIGWLLDTENREVPISDKIELLKRLFSHPFTNNIKTITPVKEYSFGRRRRIDLVIKIACNNDIRYLVIECKTDSDVEVEQLEKSKADFLKTNPGANCLFLVLAIGVGQFTYQHNATKIKGLGFEVLDVSKTLEIFSGLSIKGKSRVYDDWCNALEREKERFLKIDQVLRVMNDLRDDRLKVHGYRLGFPIYYMFYAKIRECLDKGPYKSWGIYSGTNNPVMNWQDGWIKIGAGNDLLLFYWEFNNGSLVLKAHLKGSNAHNHWIRLKNDVISFCAGSSIRGNIAKNKKGTYISIYKWKFDFCQDSIESIANETNKLLKDIHDNLRHIV